MRLQIKDTEIYRTSSSIVIQDLENNRFAVWNRYIPSIVFLNEDGVKLLKYMFSNPEPYENFKGLKRIIRKMISNNLLYSKQEDSYKEEFLKAGEINLKRIHESMIKQYQKKLPFLEFVIINQACNLKCPYCVVNYVRNKNHKPVKKTRKAKVKRLLNCIDQFFRTPQNEKKIVGRRINFNGGEILLEWPIIQTVVNYIKNEYPDETIEFNINTNATLITEEIAKFFVLHSFNTIGISIDGYRETHNTTRKYHNGAGSFDDVIRAKNTLDRYLSHPSEFYQGTLVNEHKLELDKLLEMKKYGFKRARLGVNLLEITPKQAKHMADLHFKMAITSIENDFKAMDTYFDTYDSVLNTQGTGFTFHCMGLSDLAGKCLYYNVDTEMVNTLCSFTTDVQISLNEINDDIYHSLIFEKAINFLRKRFETFKEVCEDCEIAGICRGGCVLTGIDSYNMKNEAACLFQKETWKNFLRYMYSRKNII